jgi:hypothetical protein
MSDEIVVFWFDMGAGFLARSFFLKKNIEK